MKISIIVMHASSQRFEFVKSSPHACKKRKSSESKETTFKHTIMGSEKIFQAEDIRTKPSP
jgi:hypothetical protein